MFGLNWNNIGNWSNLAGVIEGLVPLAAIGYAWETLHCGVPWCARAGKHKVDGTVFKVCNRHHTVKHHELLFHRHQQQHPERLAHGESHTLALPPGEHPHKERSA